MDTPKGSNIKTSEMIYRGSIICVIVTIPSLAAFMLTWHFSMDLITAGVVGAGVHIVSLIFGFKVANKIIVKRALGDK